MLTLNAHWSKSMKVKLVSATAWRILVLMCLLNATWQMQAQDNKAPYPSMAPIEQYRMDCDAKVALARSAAPASYRRMPRSWSWDKRTMRLRSKARTVSSASSRDPGQHHLKTRSSEIQRIGDLSASTRQPRFRCCLMS
jgi:hypothetical protein